MTGFEILQEVEERVILVGVSTGGRRYGAVSG